MSHRAWNKLQQALHENGASAADEEDDLERLLAEGDEDGQLELDATMDG